MNRFSLRGASRKRARIQWQGLHAGLASRATVKSVEPQPGLANLVITAIAAVLLGSTAVLARFFHPEHQEEEPSS